MSMYITNITNVFLKEIHNKCIAKRWKLVTAFDTGVLLVHLLNLSLEMILKKACLQIKSMPTFYF